MKKTSKTTLVFHNKRTINNIKLFKKFVIFLIDNDDWKIRYKLAEKGVELDRLINDSNRLVRNMSKKKSYEIHN